MEKDEKGVAKQPRVFLPGINEPLTTRTCFTSGSLRNPNDALWHLPQNAMFEFLDENKNLVTIDITPDCGVYFTQPLISATYSEYFNTHSLNQSHTHSN